MGRTALISHMKGKKHIVAIKASSSSSMHSFFSKSDKILTEKSSNMTVSSLSDKKVTCNETSFNNELNENSAVENDLPIMKNNSSMQSFLLSDTVTEAEIRWCLECVMEHLSFRSLSRYLDFCKKIFHDSEIAKSMQLGQTKIAYMISYGLGPYFKNMLLNDLKSSTHIVIGFDESLNKISQFNQMDLSVRYWNVKKNEVPTSYVTSAFLGHSTATDILKAFMDALSGIKLNKIVQISMDGPSVNFKFLKLLRDELQSTPLSPVILELGSCGLHTVHCAFKSAIKVTGWNVVEFLRAIYNLFKNVPARRADYVQYTQSKQFPKKFCTVRWVENKDVASRAIEILPHIKKFVESAINNRAKPTCKSFDIVKDAIKDPFLEAKLVFFKVLAEEVEPFLLKFQDDAPLAPFLFNRLKCLTKNIAERFIKQEVLMKKSPQNIDLEIDDNLKPSQNVNLGYNVKFALKKIAKDKLGSELTVLEFKNNCRSAFRKLVQKLCERSPLKYKLTKAISILDPSVFVNKVLISKYLPLCLEILVENNWISGNIADKIESEFNKLCANELVIEKMKNYRQVNRLDHFWVEVISMSESSQDLKSFVKMLLILSHGNSNIERGFSINKECIIENQKEASLVALRQVYGAIQEKGGDIAQLSISKDMIRAVRNSHAMYVSHLKTRREEEKLRICEVKEKKRKLNQLKDLEAKKLKIQTETVKELSELEKQIKNLKSSFV